MNKKYERKELSPDEIEFEKLKKACEKYGYRATLEFGSFYVKTRFENWKFDPTLNGKIKLYHKNSIMRRNQKNEWHKQFDRHMSYSRLVEYFHEHEQFRYVDSMTPFTFTKGYIPGQSLGI